MRRRGLPRAADPREQPGIHNSKTVVFGKECMFKYAPHFYVVDAFHVGHVRVNAGIGQKPQLGDGFVLKWPEVGERIVARVIVILVVTQESTYGEYGFRTQQVDPRRRNVKSPDLRALIGRPQRSPCDWVEHDGARGVGEA